MTDQPAGLTQEEMSRLKQALDELPELLEEAGRMAGTRLADGSQSSSQIPGSRPPCDLTLMAIHQTINAAWTAVIDHRTSAYAPIPRDATPIEGLGCLVDWYAPCWWSRNEVYIPLRQARTGLRRLLRIRPKPVFHCRRCGDTLTPIGINGAESDWQSWSYSSCDGCGATTGKGPALDHAGRDGWYTLRQAADSLGVEWEALRKRARRAGIQPATILADGTMMFRLSDLRVAA